MDAPAEIAVVIVSYNTRELLLACLDSVVASAGDRQSEIVVVDNASEDGSAEAVQEHYPQAHLLRNLENLGFGAACNQGVRMTRAPFILLLNSDAQLNPQALAALLDAVRRCSKGAAVGCRMVNEAGQETTNTRNFLTPFNQALELVGVPRLLPWRCCRRSYHPAISDEKLIDDSVDWLDGACLLLAREALDEVGLFDERFFMYSEDEDLCYRLRERGWQVYFTAAGTATHIGGASSKRYRFEMLEQFYVSQLLFLAKHRGATSVALYKVFMRAALTLKRLTRRSARKRQISVEQQRAFHRASGRDLAATGRSR